MRGRGILGAIVVVWLLIGVFAAWQRDYFKSGPTNCASAASIATTVIAGPLNYKFNPRVNCDMQTPQVPQPKQ
jgi:hypothetical protein